jgi:hypothetical protein
MKTLLPALVLVLAVDSAWAVPCKEKRSREPAFIALAVPEDAIRPAGADDFTFVDDATTIEQLFAKVGPPDASSGSGVLA